ncbi:MAG: hypothetical protein HFH62_04495 [Lachnospiraceae bacterium]|nr:hypothetical protein [Lachnospiraceae bacterium]
MTNFKKTQLTSLGANLVGKHGMDVTFTRVETGCGIYASGEKVDGAIGLKSKVQDISISSAARINDVLSEVKFLISNKELTQEYLLTEIGVYAMDPDDGEVLYAICFAPPEDSQVIMAFNGVFPYSAIISLKIQISAGAEVRFDSAGAVALAEDFVRQQGELDEIRRGLVCNLLYLPDAVNANSAGSASWQGGRFTCNIPSEEITVWSGEIDLPEGGYAYPASSDSADIIVVYTLDGTENRGEISSGGVLPEGSVVTEYRLERKDEESRIVADIWPMISPGKRPVTEYVPYTGDERKINRCVAFVIKSLEKLHKFCVEKFLAKEDVANNLVTTNAGWALDARQGKVLKDEINGINEDLSNICSDAVNVSIPNHDAELIFIKLGKRCLVMARHHVKGAAWDTASSGIYIPAKYRPGSTKYLSGTKYAIVLYDSGVIGLWGETGVDLWESGCASYDCAN